MKLGTLWSIKQVGTLEPSKMFFRLPRLPPRYIRYLQTQAVHSVDVKARSLVIPRMAMVLGALGIGMSGYSSRQLALHHSPSARVLQWMDEPAGGRPLAARGRFHTATALPHQAAAVPGLELQLYPVPKLP